MMQCLLLLVLARRLESTSSQDFDLKSVLAQLKTTEQRAEAEIAKAGHGLVDIRNRAMGSSLLQTADQESGLRGDLDALQADGNAFLQRMGAMLHGQKVLAKPHAATGPLQRMGAALDLIAKGARQELKKVGWTPSSFLEEGGESKEATKLSAADKKKARDAERAASRAQIHAIFADSLKMFKDEAHSAAEKLVTLHNKAVAAGRADPGEWHPFDQADAAEASSLLQTGEQAPTFADLQDEIQGIESATKEQLATINDEAKATSFAETADLGSKGTAKTAAEQFALLQEHLDQVEAGTNATLKHYDDEFAHGGLEPKLDGTPYAKLHDAFAELRAKMSSIHDKVQASVDDFANRARHFKGTPTSLLQLDAPSFEALKAALMAVQHLTLKKMIAAKHGVMTKAEARSILGLSAGASAAQLEERYANLKETLAINPQQLDAVTKAYKTLAGKKSGASKELQQARHKKTAESQRQQAIASLKVLGLGEAIKDEVAQRYHELRELEVAEFKHRHPTQELPKETPVTKAYKTLATHHHWRLPAPKKPLHPHKARMPVKDAMQLLGVTEAFKPGEIRDRYVELHKVLLSKHAALPVKLKALKELLAAYETIKEARVGMDTRAISVNSAGQLRQHT